MFFIIVGGKTMCMKGYGEGIWRKRMEIKDRERQKDRERKREDKGQREMMWEE